MDADRIKEVFMEFYLDDDKLTEDSEDLMDIGDRVYMDIEDISEEEYHETVNGGGTAMA
jgi:hypothetical protein